MSKHYRHPRKKQEEKQQNQERELPIAAVQATSVMEVPPIAETEIEQSPETPVIAIEHLALKTDDMWADAMDNHVGDVKKAIKKKAALYYSVLSPTTMDDILDQLKHLVEASVAAFALICDAWKHQNCLKFEDEDGFDLGPVLTNVAEAAQFTDSKSSDHFLRAFDFNISNSDWKRDILKALRQIYLTDSMMDFLYEIVGHFVELDTNDDGIQRLISFHPVTVTQTGGALARSLEYFKNAISDYLDEVDEAYNKYPFMDDLLADLGFKAPGDKYDFTRDLAQLKLKVKSDVDGAIADMVYMTAQVPNTGDLRPEARTTNYRIVKVRDRDGSYFKFYEDDFSSAAELAYNDRVAVAITSYTNALRGNVLPINISYITLTKTNNQKDSHFCNPFGLIVESPTVNQTAGTNRQVAKSNVMRDILDMPSDATMMYITKFNADNGDIIEENTMVPVLCSGDYLISADDIESVISDAAYALLFNPVKIENAPADAQTLGNNGKAN